MTAKPRPPAAPTPAGDAPKKYARRYPWDEWLARPALTLRPGKDFNGRYDAFVVLARGAAKRRGLRLKVSVPADGSAVHITPVRT